MVIWLVYDLVDPTEGALSEFPHNLILIFKSIGSLVHETLIELCGQVYNLLAFLHLAHWCRHLLLVFVKH